jgi:hypothetical protein
MKIGTIRRALGVVSLVLPIAWTLAPVAGQAQTAKAESYGVAVRTATINQTTPYAVLPADGAMAEDQAQSVSVTGLVTAQDVFAIATGAADATYGSSAEGTTTLGQVSILNGLITADGVVAVASSAVDVGAASADAAGSSLANLVVNGVSMPSDVAPNTKVSLPGVGYVVLNEQIRSASGITVNMIHVVQQTVTPGTCTLLGCTPDVTTTTGEIVVGSASSGVN